MKRLFLLILLLYSALSAVADERGANRLERISRYYSSLGNYALSIALRAGGAEQRGELRVSGSSSYMHIADIEVFVEDSLRYEVRRAAKEVVIDRADAYEKELLNPLNGFSTVAANYDIAEKTLDGRIVVVLTPKKRGDVVSIVTAMDGESIAKILYGAGESVVEIEIIECKKSVKSLPKFDKEAYKGFELIDFR